MPGHGWNLFRRGPRPEPEPLPPPGLTTDLKGAYVRHVEFVQSLMPHEEAMDVAVGGGFDVIGAREPRSWMMRFMEFGG